MGYITKDPKFVQKIVLKSKNCRMVIGFLTKGRVRISYKVFQLTSLKVLMCVWILFILLKTENNKKNNFQITVHAQNTVHVP